MDFWRAWYCCVILAIGFVFALAAECAICNFGPLGHFWSPLAYAIQIPNATTAHLMSFELEKGEIPPYSELSRGLE